MRTPRRQRGWSYAAAVALLAAVPAFAQEEAAEGDEGASPTASQTPTAGSGGSGFAISPDGRARLHLQLDTALGFDTNPYSAPLDRTQFSGDAVFRIRPGVSLTYPGSLISFDGGAFVDYGFLPGLIDPKTRAFLLFKSGIDLNLEINRGGMFSFAVGESFSFNSDPAQLAVGGFYTRLNNALRAGVGFRPGGGTLAFKLDYTFNFEKYFSLFQTLLPVDQGVFDSMAHYVRLRADYRFLPKTGVFAEIYGGVHLYPFDQTQSQPLSIPVTAQVGAMGQFTPSLSGLVSIGYSNPLTFNAAGSIDTLTLIGLILQTELQWKITSSIDVAGGFQRRVRPAPLYQYSIDNRVYARYQQSIGTLFKLQLAAGYNVMQFGNEQTFVGGTPLSNQPNGTRLDGILDSEIGVFYYAFEWLSLGVTNRLNWRLSNASETTTNQNYSFLRNETLGIVSLHY